MPTQQHGATKIYFQTSWHLLMPGNLTEVKECDRDVQSKILNSTSSSMMTASGMEGKGKYRCYMGRTTFPAKPSRMGDNNNEDSKVQQVQAHVRNYTKNSPRILDMYFAF